MISAIVLAAGTASRFGGTKQLARLRGRALVQLAVDTAASSRAIDEIVVVLGYDAARVEEALDLPANARTIVNPAFATGQASSLVAGLRATADDSEGAIVLLADQPGVDTRTIDRLVDAFSATGARIVRLAYRDGPGPALLSREIYDVAAHLRGDTGARALIDSHSDWVHDVPVDGEAPRDVDTPDDLRALGGEP